MKKRIAAVISLVAIALLLSFARPKGSGAGLRVVMESVPCNAPGCFESISHFNYLYDDTTKISRVGEADISPSGTYAAFEDDGKIMLYRRGSGQLKDVTDEKFAVPEKFKWNEDQSQLVITYYWSSLTIALNRIRATLRVWVNPTVSHCECGFCPRLTVV